MPNTENGDPPRHDAAIPQALPPLISLRVAFLIAAVLLASASRLIPLPPNFAPISVIACFDGDTFADRHGAFLAPFAAMFASDAILGFHVLLPLVYVCFGFNVILGWWCRSRRGPLPAPV
ncbi:DUF6580 family putative transport protein [Singulisphaera sp. Ch08]|uniref:DUF6580 family putative transport protein n=1 Tax=Singulisphaera sp. Ch08 TaxID=3120278 RepID=A0AAU7CIV3_9BACT